MSADGAAFGAFAIALGGALFLTPLAIMVAGKTGFQDHPTGFKAHARSTPYLGGSAVMLAMVTAAAVYGAFSGYTAILVGAIGLWIVGTLDDRIVLGPLPRIGAEIIAASFLWKAGLGWGIFTGDAGPTLLSDAANLAFTNLWIIALVNAVNLMDNMDGAASTIASVSGLGIGFFALVQNQPEVAVIALALAGATLGFLPYNLASPARIFLGDGGSMPIGFLLAASAIAMPVGAGAGWAVMVTVLLIGLPVLDTILVVISRRRRGVSILTGGTDHTTHRLRARMESTRLVAATLAAVQAVLCGLAIALSELGGATILAAFVGSLLLGAVAIVALELRHTGEPQAPAQDGSSWVEPYLASVAHEVTGGPAPAPPREPAREAAER